MKHLLKQSQTVFCYSFFDVEVPIQIAVIRVLH